MRMGLEFKFHVSVPCKSPNDVFELRELLSQALPPNSDITLVGMYPELSIQDAGSGNQDTTPETLGQRLRSERGNLSLRAFEEKTGLHRSLINHLEHEEYPVKRFRRRNLAIISKLLYLSPEQINSYIGTTPPTTPRLLHPTAS